MRRNVYMHIRPYSQGMRAAGAGWGTGYIAVSPAHPLHGVHYRDEDGDYNDALRGAPANITFTGPIDPDTAKLAGIPDTYWLIGFDTASEGDADETAVINRTANLRGWAVWKLIPFASTSPDAEAEADHIIAKRDEL